MNGTHVHTILCSQAIHFKYLILVCLACCMWTATSCQVSFIFYHLSCVVNHGSHIFCRYLSTVIDTPQLLRCHEAITLNASSSTPNVLNASTLMHMVESRVSLFDVDLLTKNKRIHLFSDKKEESIMTNNILFSSYYFVLRKFVPWHARNKSKWSCMQLLAAVLIFHNKILSLLQFFNFLVLFPNPHPLK